MRLQSHSIPRVQQTGGTCVYALGYRYTVFVADSDDAAGMVEGGRGLAPFSWIIPLILTYLNASPQLFWDVYFFIRPTLCAICILHMH